MPDLPADEAASCARPATRPASRSSRWSRRPRRPTTVARDRAAARGFVYVVSVTGVTGERAALPPELREVVERVRAAASVPVAVGFGIGTPEQVAAVGEIADGVIVGSRLVRAVAEAPTLEQGLDGRPELPGATAAARPCDAG